MQTGRHSPTVTFMRLPLTGQKQFQTKYEIVIFFNWNRICGKRGIYDFYSIIFIEIH